MFKVIVVLLIISCIAPLFIEGPDGKPLMTVESFRAKIAAILPGIDEQTLTPEPEKTSVYKWQDAEGNWQFGDAPPDESAERVDIGQVNSMSGDPTAYRRNPEGTAAKDVLAEEMQQLPDELIDAARDLERKVRAQADEG